MTETKQKRIRTWSIKQILETEFKELELGAEWEELLGKPSTNFSTIIYGIAKSGKSTVALKLAKRLREFGKVLYLSSEEGISSTLQKRIQQVGFDLNDKRVRFVGIRSIEQIEQIIKRVHPKFIFVDSVQVCGFKLKEFERLKLQVFKNRKSWHLISQATNSGKMTLAQGWTHEVDVKISVRGGHAKAEGRFRPEGSMSVFEKENTLFNQK